eukprot:CAMPEP_0170586406 /NCGR_PEP_ID=MMETSP0224-20130122/9731_1 /TAXON_ID=285029 /ORGANISM="Togula jolla, Strain CCCM 725" /LENGTH=118 /DNA_ID=CAMNT_0010909957 /DNA_START=968 /DNA_END=1322 /DNA_ORIENTATION=-
MYGCRGVHDDSILPEQEVRAPAFKLDCSVRRENMAADVLRRRHIRAACCAENIVQLNDFEDQEHAASIPITTRDKQHAVTRKPQQVLVSSSSEAEPDSEFPSFKSSCRSTSRGRITQP